MASNANDFRREFSAEISGGLTAFNQRFVAELRATTPIRTGQARGGWQNVLPRNAMGRLKIIPLAKNSVPYIGVLDTGTSTQAPNGIVQQALLRTRK
jgi:hypothetical protein